MNINFLRFFKLILILIIALVASFACWAYPGNKLYYVLFTLSLNLLLFGGLKEKASFFDLFIGAFFWLGFWLKFSVRMIFLDGKFSVNIGRFSGEAGAFDKALLVTACGVGGLLLAHYLRLFFFSNYFEDNKKRGLDGISDLYESNKYLIRSVFFITFLLVGLTNFYYGIYQRGTSPRVVLPYQIGGVYTWLLFFGLTSFSSILLNFEMFKKNNKLSLIILLSILESFFSNVSMISRGMVLNLSALWIGVVKMTKLGKVALSVQTHFVAISLFLVLFGTSLILVNHIRIKTFVSGGGDVSWLKRVGAIKEISGMQSSTKILLLDRWVGIEGVMAVTSYPKGGWHLWSEAWKEKFKNYGTSFFDKEILVNSYGSNEGQDMTKHHFISLPGVLAFLFYPNSYTFLFFSMLLIGVIGASIEMLTYYLGEGNLILCSLISQVVAYRFVHFGYVPERSYLLFGTIFLNLLIIYFSNKLLLWFRKGSCGGLG